MIERDATDRSVQREVDDLIRNPGAQIIQHLEGYDRRLGLADAGALDTYRSR